MTNKDEQLENGIEESNAQENSDGAGSDEQENLENTGAADGQTNGDDGAQENTGGAGAGEAPADDGTADGIDNAAEAGADDNAAASTADDLAAYRQKLKNLSSSYAPPALEEPARPAKDRDEAPEEWQQYYADIAVFKARKSQYQTEYERTFNEIKQVIIEQREAFEKNHTPEESVNFFSWLNNDRDIQNSITHGTRSMQQVYNNIYLPESRGAQSTRRVAEVKAQGARHKAIGINKRGTGAGGRFAGLKYAGRPEYSDLAETIAKEVKDLKRVDELVKNQMQRDLMRVF
jgi:hypothetical protein